MEANDKVSSSYKHSRIDMTYEGLLKSLGRNLCMNSVCWNLDIARSTLLKDSLEGFIERFGPRRRSLGLNVINEGLRT